MTTERKVVTGIPAQFQEQKKKFTIGLKDFAIGLTSGTLNFKDTDLARTIDNFYKPKRISTFGSLPHNGRQKALREQLKGFNTQRFVMACHPEHWKETEGKPTELFFADELDAEGYDASDAIPVRRATKREIIAHFLK